MNLVQSMFLIFLINFVNCNKNYFDITLPENILVGTASSAYQIEGAWNTSDKSESNWDYFVHNFPGKIDGFGSGDVACDSYNKYKEDVKIIKNIGFQFYRFSISWSRLLPKGTPDYISISGLQYYNNLINELKKNKIEPYVTIYHWDHPQILEKYGGWLNESMAYAYGKYAKVVFEKFGDRVKFFTTVNEPQIFCDSAYQKGWYPPGIVGDGKDRYMCQQNLLKGHAIAYHIYNNTFRQSQGGKIGITNSCASLLKKDSLQTDDLAFDFEVGLLAHPIFTKKGDYPESMKTHIARTSQQQGYKTSKLPVLSDYWIKKIRGTSDYFGINHYITALVDPLRSHPSKWTDDQAYNYTFNPKWTTTGLSVFKIVPEGFRKLLKTVKEKYNDPEIYILENGVSDQDYEIDDEFRINYVRSYLREMVKAIKYDKCNIKSYSYWSLLDNLEWNFGYKIAFGLVQVNMNDKNRKRTPKKSTTWLKNLLANRKQTEL